MATKKFCDFCGVEITNDLDYQIEIYNRTLEADVLTKDACESCQKKIKSAIEKEVKR